MNIWRFMGFTELGPKLGLQLLTLLQGLVRSIGASNFSVKKLEAILRCAQIPPAVCQVSPLHSHKRK